MNPKLWGDGWWYLIFLILYNPDSFGGLERVKLYIDTITRVLPCKVCQEHCRLRMERNSIISTGDINALRDLFVLIHDETSSKKIL